MAFPCPACFHPLLAQVEPDLDLECPVCRTTFKVPAPPAIMVQAPPIAKAPIPKAAATHGMAKTKGYGFLGQTFFAVGLVVIIVGIVLTCSGFEPYVFLLPMLVLLLGLLGSRFKNYLNRRKNPEVAKLTFRGLCHEGLQALGAVTLAVFLIPCLMCMLGPALLLLPGGW